MIALLMDMTLALHGKFESNLVQCYPTQLVVNSLMPKNINLKYIMYKHTVYVINRNQS